MTRSSMTLQAVSTDERFFTLIAGKLFVFRLGARMSFEFISAGKIFITCSAFVRSNALMDDLFMRLQNVRSTKYLFAFVALVRCFAFATILFGGLSFGWMNGTLFVCIIRFGNGSNVTDGKFVIHLELYIQMTCINFHGK